MVVEALSVVEARRGDGEMLMSPEDHKRIEKATASAEATTRGEIVCVVAAVLAAA